jgi:ubiquinone/menaquinone biosynthesis C-methylase UbiE
MTAKDSVYDKTDAQKYDKIISQPIYQYYVARKLTKITHWLNHDSIVLDLGCGTGVYTCGVADICHTVVGLDASSNMVKLAAAKAKKQGSKNVHFVIGDATALPFREKAFDLLFEVNLIHHLADEKLVKKGLTEQKQLIKCGGKILILDLNANSFGWSKQVIPKTLRSLIYVLLYPIHQHVINNEEEGTRMFDILGLLDGQTHIKVVYKDLGGFIPTYCPFFLFRVFVSLEKIMEASPILHKYGAHSTIVGQVQ